MKKSKFSEEQIACPLPKASPRATQRKVDFGAVFTGVCNTKSKFSEAQIVGILREGEAGVTVAEILRKHAIRRPTFYLWKATYGSAGV